MNENSFIQLDINERADLIWSDGEHIATREYYGYRINLYVLAGVFYVEVWYFSATNRIEKVEPLTDMKDLNLYLKDIDLQKLLDGYPYTSKE